MSEKYVLVDFENQDVTIGDLHKLTERLNDGFDPDDIDQFHLFDTETGRQLDLWHYIKLRFVANPPHTPKELP